MFEAIEQHAQAIAVARMWRRAHSVIRFAAGGRGSFELEFTYYFEGRSI